MFRLQLMPEPKKRINSPPDNLQCKGSSSPLGLLLPMTKHMHSPNFHTLPWEESSSLPPNPEPIHSPSSQLI